MFILWHVPLNLPAAYHLQLKDPSLFKQECFVNGTWVKASSGKTFDVHGMGSIPIAVSHL